MCMDAVTDAALRPMAPGELIHIGAGDLAVALAPQAGGRIAQVAYRGVDWLLGYGQGHESMMGWGCFPMLPWAGRLRHGRFHFRDRDYHLAANLGRHAIHGVGFTLPWQVEQQQPTAVALSLQLPVDARWPFGGRAEQTVEVVGANALDMRLSLTAGEQAMPVALGWHPWFLKPERIEFSPQWVYPRDDEGIAGLPLAAPPPGPWDDCFINTEPVVLHRSGQSLHLKSGCRHWQVFDESADATCVEPQSGPPDAFNLEPLWLRPGQVHSIQCHWEWSAW